MIRPGVINVNEYNKTVTSELFRELEKASDDFNKLQKELFSDFSNRWVTDSFHQWSRQYEYPFVYDSLKEIIQGSCKILDAGSGITFFPYHLSCPEKEIIVECCDYDHKLKEQFDSVNEKLDTDIDYFNADIKNISRPDEFYNAIYCISVLEHTDDYDSILKEFSRVTKKDGHLILTFDISTDGSADIPYLKAKELINTVNKYFYPVNGTPNLEENMLKSKELLTTGYIKEHDRKLLPWRYPYLMFFKSLLKGKIPKHLVRDLTCYCGIFCKKH